MFRHIGKKRNFIHNIRLAILLCLTAGMVNAAGFIAFSVLTTNVTGHAALLAVNLSEGYYTAVRTVALWLLLFLSGAFLSSLYIGTVGRDKPYAYSLPLFIEISILVTVGSLGHFYDGSGPATELFAGSLLFAMGLQNALVTMISGSVVRTTHLTGMFTDLGIDLSAAFLNRKQWSNDSKRRLLLRLSIITCFLSGGIIGGYMFQLLHYKTFFLPAGILLFTIFYDYFRMKYLKARSYLHKKIDAIK